MMLPPPTPLWRSTLTQAASFPETHAIAALLQLGPVLSEEQKQAARRRAVSLIGEQRGERGRGGAASNLLRQYPLASPEGRALLGVAEALLRIPDETSAALLIRDRLGGVDWERHFGRSPSLLVNASTVGLMLGERLLRPLVRADVRRRRAERAEDSDEVAPSSMKRLLAQVSEPVIWRFVRRVVRLLSRQFLCAETIERALGAPSVKALQKQGYRLSFDMLGEAAQSEQDAERYLTAYESALHTVGWAARHQGEGASPGISVKLSALHPRFRAPCRAEILDVLCDRLLTLAQLARLYGVGLCVDAEESERLELTLEIFERVYAHPTLDGWTGFGLAVQAYQTRALAVLEILADIASRVGRRIPVRLVKGAYWDSEIRRAQALGVAQYPVYTQKSATDVSYLCCARRLLASPALFLPQFATHNAVTVAALLEMTLGQEPEAFEFQRLYGMGDEIYGSLLAGAKTLRCRVYTPVGSLESLLPYLVRRMLENGASASFVHRVTDPSVPVEELVKDPEVVLTEPVVRPLPTPPELYGARRRNAAGLDVADGASLEALLARLVRCGQDVGTELPLAYPLVVGDNGLLLDDMSDDGEGVRQPLVSPADQRRVIGYGVEASWRHVRQAVLSGGRAQGDWEAIGGAARAACLQRAADLLEQRMVDFAALCVIEVGKTLADAVAEVREAVDYLRYYASLEPSLREQGRTGRGVFACLSPWNFPLAIFTGQVAAALIAGNAVVAKPAEQSPLIASAMTRLLHEAGVPVAVLQMLLGDGETIGAALVGDQRLAGVAFTGSLAVARKIQRQLARRGEAVPLVAETGGLNAMIVDSTALLEHVVRDVLTSAFGMAGQRCSALRVLYLQDDIADRLLTRLVEACKTWRVGDPQRPETDIGPVIDVVALSALRAHVSYLSQTGATAGGRLVYAGSLPEDCRNGTYFPPHIFEVASIEVIGREVFGPILHVVRFPASDLAKVVRDIRNSGYGLTFGLQTRLEGRVQEVFQGSAVGNFYVNRSMVGAVVGVQPFGGEGLSGTGPKAGGPQSLMPYTMPSVCAMPSRCEGGAGVDMEYHTPIEVLSVASHSVAGAQAAAATAAAGQGAAAAQGGNSGLHWGEALAALRQQWEAAQGMPLVIRAEQWSRVVQTFVPMMHDEGGGLGAAAVSVGPSRPWLQGVAEYVRQRLAVPWRLAGITGDYNELYHLPRGVVVLVVGEQSHWNAMIARCALALGSGNALLVVAPVATGQRLSRLLASSGGDPLLVRVLSSDGLDISVLLQHPLVAMVMLEGVARPLAQAIEQVLAEHQEPSCRWTVGRCLMTLYTGRWSNGS